MRNEQAYALVPQDGQGCTDICGVEPESEDEEGDEVIPLHSELGMLQQTSRIQRAKDTATALLRP